MNHKLIAGFFGLTRRGLWILLAGVGIILCILVLYPTVRLLPLLPKPSTRTPTASIPALTAMPNGAAPYVPAPSLVGWPSGTPATMLPSPTPSRTPSPTPTSSRTRTPTRTPTSTATATPVPFGTLLNPVPIGAAYPFPDFGTLTILQSSRSTAKPELAVVQVSFKCERPAPQQCDLNDFIIHALGGSGTSYIERFDPALPKPALGLRGLLVPGGGTQTGYIGFSVYQAESELKMSVQVFLKPGEYYFWLQEPPTSG